MFNTCHHHQKKKNIFFIYFVIKKKKKKSVCIRNCFGVIKDNKKIKIERKGNLITRQLINLIDSNTTNY